uniref:28S ribosomal protein S35, mitochondrial-like n=1 Tax=Phallusia mammillata TaxID=59560 RepID=A0A6F9DLJ5_9ASCI|nr:28S ribosomal protein S35, mitochondrial-like [Phallusia mammillata]
MFCVKTRFKPGSRTGTEPEPANRFERLNSLNLNQTGKSAACIIFCNRLHNFIDFKQCAKAWSSCGPPNVCKIKRENRTTLNNIMSIVVEFSKIPEWDSPIPIPCLVSVPVPLDFLHAYRFCLSICKYSHFTPFLRSVSKTNVRILNRRFAESTIFTLI